MKKKNLHQTGLAHPMMLLVAVLLLGVITFSAYRVGQNNSKDEQSQTDTSESSDLASTLKVTEANQSEEVEIPAEEKEAEAVEETTEKDTADKDYSSDKDDDYEKDKDDSDDDDKKKEDKTYVQMTSVSAVQNGSVVDVASQLPSTMSGTCHFKLWHDDEDRMYSSSTISNSRDCVGQIDISNAPTYDDWELHVWFDSSDMKTFGWQTEVDFPLTDPN